MFPQYEIPRHRPAAQELSPLAAYETMSAKIDQGIERGRVVVVFSDIDSTLLLGSGYSQQQIQESHQTAKQLIESLNASGAIIIPITGTGFGAGTQTTSGVRLRMEAGVLPQIGMLSGELFSLDALVSDGGGQAWQRGNVRDPEYQQMLSSQHFDYSAVRSLLIEKMAETNLNPVEAHDRVIIDRYDQHAHQGRIQFQPGSIEGHHQAVGKIAAFFYAETLEQRDAIELKFQLAFPGIRIVCCEERDANTVARRDAEVVERLRKGVPVPLKYCLDLVPFDKGSAVDFYADKIMLDIAQKCALRGKPAPALEIWACGDSGNDHTLMRAKAVTNVVMVGGASPELVRLAQPLRDIEKKVYVESDSTVFGPLSIERALRQAAVFQ